MKKKESYSEEFEEKWLANKKRLLMEDEEYKKAIESYEMKSATDWLLFIIPIVSGIISMQYIPISHELLLWVASIGITIVVFAVCVMVKSMMNPHRAISDIEADVKRRYWEKVGKGNSAQKD